MTTTERETRILRWSTALDNYEPTRDFAYGDALHYAADDVRGETIVVHDALDKLRDANRATYLVDDGRTVSAWYVAGWHDAERTVFLQRFPTNYNADGSPRLRADDGRPVDFGTWMLGPRRAYHLKVRWDG